MWTRPLIASFMRVLTLKTIEVGAGVGVGAEGGPLNAVHHLLHLVEKEKERGKGEGSDSSRGLVN